MGAATATTMVAEMGAATAATMAAARGSNGGSNGNGQQL